MQGKSQGQLSKKSWTVTTYHTIRPTICVLYKNHQLAEFGTCLGWEKINGNREIASLWIVYRSPSQCNATRPELTLLPHLFQKRQGITGNKTVNSAKLNLKKEKCFFRLFFNFQPGLMPGSIHGLKGPKSWRTTGLVGYFLVETPENPPWLACFGHSWDAGLFPAIGHSSKAPRQTSPILLMVQWPWTNFFLRKHCRKTRIWATHKTLRIFFPDGDHFQLNGIPETPRPLFCLFCAVNIVRNSFCFTSCKCGRNNRCWEEKFWQSDVTMVYRYECCKSSKTSQ